MSELLSLPDDILEAIFTSWIGIKEVTRFDSAISESYYRLRSPSMIQRWSGDEEFMVNTDVDQYVRWRAEKHLPIRSVLSFHGPVTENFIQNSERTSDVLSPVRKLKRGGPVTNGSLWLGMVVCHLRNLDEICASDLTLQDVSWLTSAFSQNAAHLLIVKLEQRSDAGMQTPLPCLLHACVKLRELMLLNCSCVGVDVLVQNNQMLTCVELNSCESMTNSTFVKILNLPLLERMHLANGRTITGAGKLNITTTALHTFTLHRFTALTSRNLKRIYCALPRTSSKLTLEVQFVGMLNLFQSAPMECARWPYISYNSYF